MRLIEFSSCLVCVCFSVWSWAGTVSTWWSEETTGSSRCGALTTWTSCTPILPVIAVCAHWPCHTIRGEIHNNLKLCSDSAEANAKVNIFFDVCRLFFDLFRLFFYLSHFRLVWIGSKGAFTLSESEHFLWSLSLLNVRAYSHQAKAKKITKIYGKHQRKISLSYSLLFCSVWTQLKH